MKKFLLTFLLTLVASNIFAKDIQLFNAKVLGSKVSDPVVVLTKQNQNDLEPINVLLDIQDGYYTAATAIYPEELGLAEVKANLNRYYQKYESEITRGNSKYGLWRNVDEKFAMQITTDDENNILVIYVKFISNKQ